MYWSTFTSGPGGVSTREVGTIRGDLEIQVDGTGDVMVRYAGALDEYTVAGGPVDVRTPVDAVIAWLECDLGTDDYDNPIPVTLDDTPF